MKRHAKRVDTGTIAQRLRTAWDRHPGRSERGGSEAVDKAVGDSTPPPPSRPAQQAPADAKRVYSDPYVITELALNLSGPPPEGEPHPERTPIGPFESRDSADAWAQRQVSHYGGDGSWSVAPLRSPEAP